jgi:fibronectin type 3 domain-containing protein
VIDSVNPLSSEALQLKWTSPSGAPGSYRIERSDSQAGPFNPLIQISGAATDYIDQSLNPNVPYYYRIVAINESGESQPSNVGTGKTFNRTLPAPT